MVTLPGSIAVNAVVDENNQLSDLSWSLVEMFAGPMLRRYLAVTGRDAEQVRKSLSERVLDRCKSELAGDRLPCESKLIVVIR